MFVRLFHVVVPAAYMYTLWYDQMYVDLPFPSKQLEEMPLKARYIFLTLWCLVLQTVYFTITLLNDIIGTDQHNPRKRPFITKLRDFTFSIAFPLAIFVAMTFWGLYIMDKELIMPEAIEKTLPKWVNHMMHSMIVVFIVIEMFVTNKTYPSRRVGVNTVVGVAFTYFVWVHIIYYNTGVWVYPFLDLFNHVLRTIFFSFTVCIGAGLYVFGEKLNSLLTPKSVVYTNGVNKKKY